MKPFQHLSPGHRTFAGEGCLAALPAELKRAGASRVVLFCGASLARQPEALARVERALGPALAGRFEGVREHSPVDSVVDGARTLARLGADGAVAVGGGSAVVTARAAAILLAEGEDVRALCTRREPDGRMVSPKLARPKLPQFVVATTPTTAYAKAGSALRDPATGDRLALFDPKTRASALFVDPVLAGTAPVGLVTSASLNALAMSIEGLESDSDDPLAHASLAHALGLLADAMPGLVARPDDADLRMRLMLAALLCGQGTDHAGGGVSSVLAHSIGPRYGVANGLAQAIVLPHAMRFNAPVTAARLSRVDRALGTGAAEAAARGPEAVVGTVRALLDRLGVPARLGEVGVTGEVPDALVEHALADWFLQRNPRPVDRSGIVEILGAAW